MTKILIIEDTQHLRNNLVYALKKEGYEVIEAADGKIGVSMAQENLPDLILCDIVMPGMDGYDVLKSLKLEDGTIPFPFIFITALAERKNFRDGMELGADDFLVKPFTIEELLNAINSRLLKYDSIERRFTLQFEQIENELKTWISTLEEKNKIQKMEIDDISISKADAIKQLNEKQTKIMEQSLRSVEINTTMQDMAKEIMFELNRNEISERQRKFLVQLRNKIRNRSVLLNNLTIFQVEFNLTYPRFIPKLINQYPELTKQELSIISAIFSNLNSHQISVILGIKAPTVRKYKYRIKKKLNLIKEEDLYQHILQMNLND